MIDLLTYEYEKFSIFNEETIDSGFTQFNAIVTSLKSLHPDYSSKNHVRKFLRALPLKWRAKVLDNDGVVSKTTKEKVKSLALEAKVTREQTSNDSDSQDGSDEDIEEEEEVKAFNLIARNFYKFFRKGYRFGRGNRFSNGGNRFGAWSDCEDDDEPQMQHVSWKLNLKRLFTSYKAYDGGHVILGSNLKGNVVGGANITHGSITITNVQHVSGLAFSLIRVGYSQASKAYIALNKETMIIEESLNVSFDECFPEPKSSPLVKDDRIIEPVVKNPVRSPSLEANASESGYPKSLKEVRGYPIKQVIDENSVSGKKHRAKKGFRARDLWVLVVK
ncbi:hypothetical protein Tco_1071628 [Tanacetum coccineum]